MNRDDVIERLKLLEPELRARGASSLSLFGSTARNAAKSTSDIDIFYTVNSKSFSLIEMSALSRFLRGKLKMQVDAFPLSCLKPAVRKVALAEGIKVF